MHWQRVKSHSSEGTLIYDDVMRLANAHPDHQQLAELLGVHLTTLKRWLLRTAEPNQTHRERIGQLLGEMEQGELFHTTPGVAQSEATNRYGTPPIPGLMVYAASQAADSIRLKRFAQHIPIAEWTDPLPRYRIGCNDVHAYHAETFGAPVAQDTPTSGAPVQKGDLIFATDPVTGRWRLGPVNPAYTPGLGDSTVLVLRPKSLSAQVLARLIQHPIVLHQVMPYSVIGSFSELFIDRLMNAVLPIEKSQIPTLQDWGARLDAAKDECHVLERALSREVDKATADWQSDMSFEQPDDR